MVRADGIDYDGAMLLDAKHVGKPEISPYVPGSGFPAKVKPMVLQEVNSEFRRYGAVINDPHTPVIGLRVITNDPSAVEFFLELMERWKVPGYIIVKD